MTSEILTGSQEYWPFFQRWCAKQGLQAFPASPRTVLLFLSDPPVTGPSLFRAWQAIDLRHSAFYWHTDANPVMLLTIGGVSVEPDGTIDIPRFVAEKLNVSMP